MILTSETPMPDPRSGAAATHACSVFVAVSQPVVTDLRAFGSLDPRQAPNVMPLYTIAVASVMVGQTRDNIRHILHRYPELFDPPKVQHTVIAGRRSTRFPRRLLSARDLDTLRSMFPIISVK